MLLLSGPIGKILGILLKIGFSSSSKLLQIIILRLDVAWILVMMLLKIIFCISIINEIPREVDHVHGRKSYAQLDVLFLLW